MKTQHTQGEWIINGELDETVIQSRNGDEKGCDGIRQICEVKTGNYEIPDYDELQANAKLIASAPELLEALDCIVSICNDDQADLEVKLAVIRTKANKAIKKATL